MKQLINASSIGLSLPASSRSRTVTWTGPINDDIPVVEVYINDPVLGTSHNFTIREGYEWTWEQEQLFHKFADNNAAFTTSLSDHCTVFKKYYSFLSEETFLADTFSPLQQLERIYYVLHPCLKELFIKAKLSMIGMYLDNMQELNLLGSTPSEITDLPIKILRVLNRKAGIPVISPYKNRVFLKQLYQFHPALFTEMWSYGQCRYFSTVFADKQFSVYPESIEILNNMSEIDTEPQFQDFMLYLQKREAVLPFAVLPLTPFDDMAQRKADYLLHHAIIYDMDYQDYTYWIHKRLEYQDEKYSLAVIVTAEEICRLSTEFKNCLWTYLHRIHWHDTVILFMTSKRTNTIVAAIEIRNHSIIQARGPLNASLSHEEYIWLLQYSKLKFLNFEILPEDDFY